MENWYSPILIVGVVLTIWSLRQTGKAFRYWENAIRHRQIYLVPLTIGLTLASCASTQILFGSWALGLAAVIGGMQICVMWMMWLPNKVAARHLQAPSTTKEANRD